MSFRSKLAIRCAKTTNKLIRKLKRGSGVTLPGYVARLIDPKILTHLATQVKEQIIVTMGTNGKTTTNALMYQTLKAEGNSVIINRTGANMLNGIISAFVLATEANGSLQADYACIECDEIASVSVLPLLKPHVALLTNISRDQLDRFGEIDITFQKIKTAFSKVPNATLIINCDDVLSYTLALEGANPYVTFGIDEQIFDGATRSEIRESIFCRRCGNKLIYDFFHYGHLGKYHCDGCGLVRPKPDYVAEHIERKDEVYSFHITEQKRENFTSDIDTKSELGLSSNTVIENDNRLPTSDTENESDISSYIELNTTIRSPYNIYNTLSAVVTLKALKAHILHLKSSIESFDYGNQRESIFHIGKAQVHLHLAKNPIGFQQKISLVLKDEKPKDLIILINDTYQDGEDVSWLWDVDFQHLADTNIGNIITTGVRKYDMSLRLKYEDIPCKESSNLENTIKELLANGTENLYVIVNYTGLYSTNALLTRLSQEV